MDRELKKRAKTLFPDKVTYNLKETAAIMGLSPQTLYNGKSRYRLGKRNTLSQIEKAMSPREANTGRHQKAKSHDMTQGEYST